MIAIPSNVRSARPPRPIVRVKPDPAGIPDELKARPQWLCWRLEWREGKNGKPGAWAKVPRSPRTGAHASVDEPASWADFAAAWSAYQRAGAGYDGIGYVFAADDPYTGADFDKCRDPETGELTAKSRAGVDSLYTYSEISQSGTGVHCLMRAALPHADAKQTGKRRDGTELYDRGRFFAITGKRLDDTPATIEDRQEEAEGLYRYLAGGAADTGKRAGKPQRAATPAARDMADADVIAALQAERGGKAARLWSGDTSGYASASEARAALIQKIRFRVGDDAARIEGILRQSGLADPKLDDERGDQTFAAYDVARILAHMPIAAYYSDGRAPEAEAEAPAVESDAEMEPVANLAGGDGAVVPMAAFQALYNLYTISRRSEDAAWGKVRELQAEKIALERDDWARRGIMKVPHKQMKPPHKAAALVVLDEYRYAEKLGKLDPEKGGVEIIQAKMEDKGGIPTRSQNRVNARNEKLGMYTVYSKIDENGHPRTYYLPHKPVLTGNGYTPTEEIKHGGKQEPCPICGIEQGWLVTEKRKGKVCGHEITKTGIAGESADERAERLRAQLRNRHTHPRHSAKPTPAQASPDPEPEAQDEPVANLAGGDATHVSHTASVFNTQEVRQNGRRPDAEPDSDTPLCPDCGKPTHATPLPGRYLCRTHGKLINAPVPAYAASVAMTG